MFFQEQSFALNKTILGSVKKISQISLQTLE